MILKNEGKSYFQIAVLTAILVHGVLIFFTFEKTYDAYVHIFFANHYVESWFDHWEYRWYTGFTMTSYPPQIHQLIAVFSLLLSLKGAFVLVAMLSAAVFIRGVYVFSKLWVDERSAGIASLLAVVSSSYVEALHIFGQLPSITGIALLLNTTPFVYQWIRNQRWIHLLMSISLLSVVTTIHHVTTIFGMVFFIFPVIGLAIMDNIIEQEGSSKEIKLWLFGKQLIKVFKPAIILGILTIIVTIISIFPYWVWSSSDPITQVPIPHGSRDDYLAVASSGLVFFLIPWGMLLFFLPHLFRRIFTKRTIILALSISGAFLLGTGGTTPLPRMILGENAFNILTLDRFTYWATIMALPFFGYYIQSLFGGNFKGFLIEKYGYWAYRVTAGFWMAGILLSTVMIVNIHYFNPLQPKKIDINPLVNFLERDQHDQWRYLTLGFGDQVAWLSANTKALTVDGNYHSARRLPELTTRKVERLENAKYLGTQGIGALHQFLTVPEKYHLKYIFSNDQFYNPILHFSGWQKLRRLENNIDIWMKPDITPLPSLLPRKDIPQYQQLMWSLLPFTLLSICIFLNVYYHSKDRNESIPKVISEANNSVYFNIDFWWIWILSLVMGGIILYQYTTNKEQTTPENLMTSYFDALDFKYFEKAFSFYDKENASTIDQMLIDLSREDAITTSYAKLNSLDFKTEYYNEEKARIKVNAEWITSISTYETFHDFDLLLNDGKWWIVFDQRDFEKPAEQIFSTPSLEFFNQGKRDIKNDYTAHTDILDRPNLLIEESNLVRKGENYHVVGKVTNIDNDPAYVNISSTLFDSSEKEIVSYNSREVIVHYLLPKESTYFRIDFEDIANQTSLDAFPDTFDPLLSDPFSFIEEPKDYIINAQSVVSTIPIYKNYGVAELELINQGISGTFINTGAKEINIPHLITAHYQEDTLMWVSSDFINGGVRPQRAKPFLIENLEFDAVQLIMKGKADQLLVNSRKSSELPQFLNNERQKSKTNLIELRSKYLVEVKPSGYVNE